MFNKQINNIKFKELKNGTMEITYPNNYNNGMISIVPFEDGMDEYRKLFAQKYADKIFEEVLRELNIDIMNAHLLSDTDLIRKNGHIISYTYPIGKRTTYPKDIFNIYLEKALLEKKLQLPYIDTVSPKYKIKIGGSASAIAWYYSRMIFDTPWKEFEVDVKTLRDYIKSHKNIRILEEFRSERKLININKLLETKFGIEEEHRGYGSQASTAIRTVKLKKDNRGNLLIEHGLEIWD